MPVVRWYWRLRRPSTSGARVILTDLIGHVVLVRHANDGLLYLPGGAAKRGEEPVDAAVRELEEELRLVLDADAMTWWSDYESNAEGKRDTITLFTGCLGAQAALRPASPEVSEVLLVDPRAELPPSVSPGTARRLKEWVSGSSAGGRW